jgi:hypothetical protein
MNQVVRGGIMDIAKWANLKFDFEIAHNIMYSYDRYD